MDPPSNRPDIGSRDSTNERPVLNTEVVNNGSSLQGGNPGGSTREVGGEGTKQGSNKGESIKLQQPIEGSTKPLSNDQECTKPPQSDNGSTKPPQPDKISTKPLQPDDGSTKSLQPDDQSIKPQQSDEESTKSLQPDEGSTKPLQPGEGSTKPIQPDERFTQPLQSDEGSTKSLQPDEGSTKPLQPDEQSTKPLQPDDRCTQKQDNQESTTNSLGQDYYSKSNASAITPVPNQVSSKEGNGSGSLELKLGQTENTAKEMNNEENNDVIEAEHASHAHRETDRIKNKTVQSNDTADSSGQSKYGLDMLDQSNGTSEVLHQSKTASEDIMVNSNTEGNTANIEASDIFSTSEKIGRVLIGQCTFGDLPPLPKKIVRIFVSSTFTDTKEERNALMKNVYPKLSDYCRDHHGLEFQVVDMRWGIPEQASDNHSTTDLCIQEIKKCQEVSVGPNFVALLGDKYGYRPVPGTIPADVFEILRESRTRQENVNWGAVETWYRNDENAVPPVYILQPISTILLNYNNTENQDLRKEAQNEWQKTHSNMAETLRVVANESHQSGHLSEAQKRIFFMSVTENEITHGVFRGETEPQHSCFCIIRKITDITIHLSESNAYRFTDITETSQLDQEAQSLLSRLRDKDLVSRLPVSNLSQIEVEWSASGAAISLDKFPDADLGKHASDIISTTNIPLEKHREYLDTVCKEFFQNIKNLVKRGGDTQKKLYDDLTSDILQHWHLAKLRCDIFEGRENILEDFRLFLSSDLQPPLTIHGNSGCGKTSIMAKVMENVTHGRWISANGKQFIFIARFLGTTPNTSNLHTLLVSMCTQLSLIKATSWREPEQFSELIKDFHRMLKSFTPDRPLVLMLDSIDQLMPAYNAFKLDWLPTEVIPNVHLILSTIDEGYTILGSLKTKYDVQNAKFIEIKPLGETLGYEVISKWFSKDNRTVTSQQNEVIRLALEKCSLPLYARVAYDHIRRWKSYDVPSIDQLQTTVRGVINQLYASMESKFGSPIVKHALAYLTASRYGLSETEMEHILSLDDLLLNQVFKFWEPPIRRIPPLLWTRVRTEIHSYIVERSADDSLILYWYHRQFIEATKEKYLKDQSFSKHIHEHLTEYFLGLWGGGKEKPFFYTEEQMKRFKLSDPKGKADRKVPQQPYIFESTEEKDRTDQRYNKRKLTELPYQLFKCRNHEGLKRHVFFNYDWLLCKIKSTSVAQVIEEIELFMQADKIMKKDIDMKILYVNIQLVRSFISQFPDSLSYELSGRLAKYVGKSEALTGLLKQCDAHGGMVVPLSTCFESASLGMQQNITFRSSEPWQQGGCFTCSKDFKRFYVIDYDEHGLPVLISYDLDTGEKIHKVQIKKTKEEKYKMTVDEYFQLDIAANGKVLLAFYKQKFIAGYNHTYRKDGLFDVINPDDGHVMKTHEGFLYREDFLNPLQYCTENWVCVRFGWKLPLINITNDKRKELNRPHLLSPDEKFFIMCGQKKTDMREFVSKSIIGEFDVSDSQIAVAAAQDFSIVALLSSRDKILKIFDLGKKYLHPNKRYGYILKWKKSFNLEDKVANTVNELTKSVTVENEKGECEEKTNNSVSMVVGPDDRHLLVTFRGTLEYVTYLWNMGRWNARFIGAVTPRMPLVGRYPTFNYDATCVIYTHGKKVLILSTEDCSVLNEYEMSDDVKDFYASKVSNKVLVMLSKSIVVLEVLKTSMRKSHIVKANRSTEAETKVLLPRETVPSVVHKEITIEPYQDTVEVEEVSELAMTSNTDRIASARSRKEYALEKHITPNGLRVVHYHSKIQVIDTLHEEIKYSPKKGDCIQRVVSTDSTSASTETIAIAGLDPTRKIASFDLMQGDRIVSDGGKIKFRVTTESNGQLKLITVPSVFSVYTVEEMKLEKLQNITVYEETLMTVSNDHIVTCRVKGQTHFVNVYHQESGKLVATHEVPLGTDCVRMSIDDAQLFVVDRSLCVRVYLAPTFNSLEQKVETTQGEFSAFKAKDVLTFQSERSVIVLVYGLDSKDAGRTGTTYRHINLVTKDIGPAVEVSPHLEDISSDGAIAVDSKLQVYDLITGKILFTVQYVGAEREENLQEQRYDRLYLRKLRFRHTTATMQLRVRISWDRKFIVYVDKQDDTLHIGKLHDAYATHLFSCYTHAPDILMIRGVEIRLNGAIVVLRGDDFCMPFLIKTEEYDSRNVSYVNEMSRALTLVSPVLPQDDVYLTTQDHTQSVYYRRNVLLQQEPQKSPEDVKLKEKPSRKPSVLVFASHLLYPFRASRFSTQLDVEKVQIASTEDAYTHLKTSLFLYDCIVVQQVSDDVKRLSSKKCIDNFNLVVDKAQERCSHVVISLSPPRVDSQELNKKLSEINTSIQSLYNSRKGVVICSNSNLSENGKPVEKYFKDHSTLSLMGIKQVAENLKAAIFRQGGLIKSKLKL